MATAVLPLCSDLLRICVRSDWETRSCAR